MKMPLGRLNCFHWSRNLPSWSKNLDAVVLAVADEQTPLRIHGERVRHVELAGPGAFLPHVLMNLPSLANFTMRALVSPPWPSATKMSPLGAATTADGALNSSGPLPGYARLAEPQQNLSVRTELEDLVALPVLARSRRSPRRCRLCPRRAVRKDEQSAPKLFTSLPEASNFRIGARLDPSQANGRPGCRLFRSGPAKVPQRSNTQTLVPSGSTSTPAVDPHVRPSASSPSFRPSDMDWVRNSSVRRFGHRRFRPPSTRRW